MGTPSCQKNKDRCLFSKLHISTAMRLLVLIGTIAILALVGLLFVKFRKAMFILLIPTSIVLLTVAGIISRRDRLIWPIISVSMFHVILSLYALLIFSFYFIFKPFYIIMVLNWAFNTLHTDKTPSYYLHCTCIYTALISFLTFNAWQGMVSYRFRELLLSARRRQPTVVVVNKPTIF